MKTKIFIIFIALIGVMFGVKTTLAEYEVENFAPTSACAQPKVSAPIATTIPATASTTSAKLQGLINPNNGPTKYWFEYGTTDKLNSSTGFIYAGENIEDVMADLELGNLKSDTKYYYRIVAENNLDIVYGEIKDFKTIATEDDIKKIVMK